jgi:hypothetical protein
MEIKEALAILSAAAKWPRAFQDWPANAGELAAEQAVRAAGNWHLLPEWRLTADERAALEAEQAELWALAQVQGAARMAELAAAEEARKALERAEEEARAKKMRERRAREDAAGPVRVEAQVVYLGAGFYGIRVEKKLRPTREIVLCEMTAADKGRVVVVEVYRFDAKIVGGAA